MCLLWSSCSGCLVLDINPKSCVITNHTLGLSASPQHAWQDFLALLSVMRETRFRSAWSPHHSQDPGWFKGQLPPDHGARELRCSMAPVPVALHKRTLVSLKAVTGKSPEVQVKFLCGRRYFLLRVENKEIANENLSEIFLSYLFLLL